MIAGIAASGGAGVTGAATAGAGPIYWGALIQGSLYGLPDPGMDMRAVDVYESHAGRKVSLIHLGETWYRNGVAQPFPRADVEAVRLHGAVPFLTWGSTDSSLSGTNAPSFRSSVVAGGSYDDYIRSFANAARDWGHPFFLRFDWEMNGWWYAWAEGRAGTTGNVANGNAPGDYVRMWRHVHDIFEQVGATNVTWVWCINEMSQTTAGVHPAMSQIYPGDAYVDWTSYDAYNRYAGWESFDTMSTGAGATWLLNSYQSLLAVAPGKPIMLAEFGSKEDMSNGQRKPDWLTDALVTQIPTNFPQIKAIIYYNRNTGGAVATDPDATVAIESSPQSQSAFAAGINSGYYASNTFASLPAGRIQPLQPGLAAAPPADVVLSSAAVVGGAVSLQWSTPAANGSPVSGYRIYRGGAAGSESLLASVGAVNSYLDAAVVSGTTYWYRVSALNGIGESALSNELTATISASPLMVSDAFDRTVGAGLGSADTGGAWSVSSSTRTKVGSSEGIVYGWTGGNQDTNAASGPTATNMELLALVRLNAVDPVGASYSPRLIARAQADARNGYSARITHTPSGSLTWLLSRTDNAGGSGSVAFASGTLAASAAAGSRWWIRLRVEDTTIRSKFWRDGQPEPTSWTATANDSYWHTGRAALGVYAATGLTTPYPDTGFTTFQATNLG